MDIAPGRKLDVLLQNCGPIDSDYAKRNLPTLGVSRGVAAAALADERPRPFRPWRCSAPRDPGADGGLIDPNAELDRLPSACGDQRPI